MIQKLGDEEKIYSRKNNMNTLLILYHHLKGTKISYINYSMNGYSFIT